MAKKDPNAEIDAIPAKLFRFKNEKKKKKKYKKKKKKKKKK